MEKHKFKLTKHKDNEKKLYIAEFLELLPKAKKGILENINKNRTQESQDEITEEKFYKNFHFFYRGQAYFQGQPLPGILRDDNYKKHENFIYNEVKVECSKEFEECKTHLDILTKMQHYGVPTRLLDVSKNALTSLYFSCKSAIENKKAAEVIIYAVCKNKIKFPNSDAVTLLSSLPLLEKGTKDEILKQANSILKEFSIYKDKENKIINEFQKTKEVNRLVHEARNEKPGFESKVNPRDILSRFIVLSEKKNERISKQDGAFIIYGLGEWDSNGEGSRSNDSKKYTNDNIHEIKIYIQKRCCKDIITELDHLGIRNSTIYPDMYKLAEELKEKYKSSNQ